MPNFQFVFYFYALLRLNWYTKRLSYFLLSRQNLIQGTEKGFFVTLSSKLDKFTEKEEERFSAEKEKSLEKLLKKEGIGY